MSDSGDSPDTLLASSSSTCVSLLASALASIVATDTLASTASCSAFQLYLNTVDVDIAGKLFSVNYHCCKRTQDQTGDVKGAYARACVIAIYNQSMVGTHQHAIHGEVVDPAKSASGQ